MKDAIWLPADVGRHAQTHMGTRSADRFAAGQSCQARRRVNNGRPAVSWTEQLVTLRGLLPLDGDADDDADEGMVTTVFDDEDIAISDQKNTTVDADNL